MIEEVKAVNIIENIAECLSVISSTNTNEVKGARVTPVKKAIIPNSVYKLLLPILKVFEI